MLAGTAPWIVEDAKRPESGAVKLCAACFDYYKNKTTTRHKDNQAISGTHFSKYHCLGLI